MPHHDTPDPSLSHPRRMVPRMGDGGNHGESIVDLIAQIDDDMREISELLDELRRRVNPSSSEPGST